MVTLYNETKEDQVFPGQEPIESSSGASSSGLKIESPTINTPKSFVSVDISSAEKPTFFGNSIFTGGYLRSKNFVSGSAGWAIDASGNVEFNNGTFRGTLTATAGAIGGFDIGSDYIRDVANSFGLASTVTGGDDVRFWAGGTYANRATANLRIYESGDIEIDYGASLTLVQGGNVYFTSLTAPTACTATLVATGTGNVDNGTHKYRVVFVNSAGQTNLGSESNTVTVDASNKQVSLSAIPTSTSNGVTSRKIYRTKAGGTVLFYLLTTIADNATTTYTDNTADASLSSTDVINTTAGATTENSSFGKIYVEGIKSLSLGSVNTLIGQGSGFSLTVGYQNTAVGANSLYSNAIGNYNTAIGVESIYSNTTGTYNSGLGYRSLKGNTTGYENSAVGVNSLISNTTGYENSAVGTNSLFGNTTGYLNVAVGYHAGRFLEDGSSENETSNQSVFLGIETWAKASGGTNEIVIGANNIGNGSNTATIGNTSLVRTFLRGITNIKTKTPASASATGTTGDIGWDASYIYVCTATDTWKRVAIATW